MAMRSHERKLEVTRRGCCDGCVESLRKIKSEKNMRGSIKVVSVTRKITEKRQKKRRRARTKKKVICTNTRKEMERKKENQVERLV